MRQSNIPMVALRGMTILPHTTVHFDVSRSESIEAVKRAMAGNQYLYVVTQLDIDNSQGIQPEGLHKVGCIVKVRQMMRIPKNVVRVLVDGEYRGALLQVIEDSGYYQADVQLWEDEPLTEEENEAYCTSLLEAVRTCYEAGMKQNPAVLKKLSRVRQTDVLIDTLAEQMPISYEKRQEILEIADVRERVMYTLKLLKKEAEISQSLRCRETILKLCWTIRGRNGQKIVRI